MKLHPSSSDRTLMENGMYAYRGKGTTEDVDNSPEYFDDLVNDLIDPEKYVQSPLASGLGTHFLVFLGDVHRQYSMATFRVDGLKTITNEHGIKQYQLLWSRVTNWDYIDVEEGFLKRMRRGPGRPRKEEVAA